MDRQGGQVLTHGPCSRIWHWMFWKSIHFFWFHGFPPSPTGVWSFIIWAAPFKDSDSTHNALWHWFNQREISVLGIFRLGWIVKKQLWECTCWELVLDPGKAETGKDMLALYWWQWTVKSSPCQEQQSAWLFPGTNLNLQQLTSHKKVLNSKVKTLPVSSVGHEPPGPGDLPAGKSAWPPPSRPAGDRGPLKGLSWVSMMGCSLWSVRWILFKRCCSSENETGFSGDVNPGPGLSPGPHMLQMCHSGFTLRQSELIYLRPGPGSFAVKEQQIQIFHFRLIGSISSKGKQPKSCSTYYYLQRWRIVTGPRVTMVVTTRLCMQL